MAVDRTVVIRLVSEVSGFSSGMQTASRETSDLERRVASMTRAVRAAASQSAAASAEVSAARARESAAAERVAAAETRLNGARARTQAVGNALTQAEARLAELRASGTASSAEIAAAEARVNGIRTQATGAADRQAMAERRLAAEQSAQARAAAAATAAQERATAAAAAQAAAQERSIQRTQEWNAAAGKMATAGAVMIAGLGMAVKQFADFDQAMSGVRANIDATPAQFTKLTSAVRQAGADSVFSAKEAANAAEELAKAGMNVTDIISGGLTGALALASAGELGLGQAAEIAAQSMAMFHLKGKDVTHIADVLASGANASTASVESLAQGLSQGGGVAAMFGMSLEETVGTLSLFDQNALKGSDAGTSLKTMLTRLTPQSDQAAAAMQEVGLKAYDANGKFIGLTAVAEQLKTGMAHMSQEQRNAAMNTIFGSDAVRAANILYKEGAQGLQSYIDQVSKTGVAAQIAAAKQNNLKGDLEKLKGSLDDLLIGAGEGANGPLRSLVQNVDAVVSAFGKIPSSAQSAIIQIGAFGGASLIAAAGAIKIVNTIRNVGAEFRRLRAAMAGSTAISSALERIRGAAERVGTAFQNMSTRGKVAVGILGVALVAAAATAVSSGKDLENAGRSSAFLANDMQKATKSGQGMNDMFSNLQIAGARDQSMSFSRAMEELHSSMGKADDKAGSFTKGVLGWTGALHGAQSPLAAVKERLGAMGNELAQMVEAGDINGAAAQFQTLAKEAEKSGISTDELMKLMPAYSDALARHETEIGKAATAQEKQNSTAKKAKEALDQQKASIEDLVDAYKNLGDVLMQQEASQDGANASVDAAKKAIKENGRAIDENSEKGRNLRGAMRDIVSSYSDWASATLSATGSQEQANAITAEGKRQYIASSIAAGKNADEAKKLADQLFKLPNDVTTSVNVDGVKAATYGVDQFGNEVVKLQGTSITVPVDTPNAPQTIQMLTALKGSALSADKTKVTIPTSAIDSEKTRKALMGIDGAKKDANGNVTIPTSALNSDVTLNALRQLNRVAIDADGRVVQIPASAPNAAAVKSIIEQTSAAAVTANSKRVNITTTAPLAPDVIKKLQGISGVAVDANKKTVHISTAALNAADTKAKIQDLLATAQNKTITITTIQKVIKEGASSVNSALGFGASGGNVNALPKRRFAGGGSTMIGGKPYGFMDGTFGGEVRGPGTGTSDQVITRSSAGTIRTANGEHILTAREVAQAGGHGAIYRLRAAIRQGLIRGFASGGAAGSDWTPDMSTIMSLASSYKVDQSSIADQQKKMADRASQLQKAARDLNAARAALARAKPGEARIKAENRVADILAKQKKLINDQAAAQKKLTSDKVSATLDTTGRFMKATGVQNGITSKFLSNVEKISKRGFPKLALSLLEQGDMDATYIAQTLANGSLDRLRAADKGLQESDRLADKKQALIDQLSGVTSAALQASAIQEANAQLLALRGANTGMQFAGGASAVKLDVDYQRLAKAIVSATPAPKGGDVVLTMDGREVGRAVAPTVMSQAASAASNGSVLPGWRG